MRTIIAFDSWTAGAHHFERLVPAFETRGYQLLLIHIGSWGHDKNRPIEEYIGKLKTRDISYYHGIGFAEILKRENPAAILFLSTRAFAHQAFNRYAIWLKIPTIHLLHGLIYVQAVGVRNAAYKTNYIQLISMWRQRVQKNLFKLIPSYGRSLLDTRATLPEWLAMGKELFAKISGRSAILAPLDCKTTAGLVYTRADIPFLRDGYHIAEKDIYIVGNPDLIRFGLDRGDFGVGCKPNLQLTNEIIYIDTALSESGFVFNDAQDFIQHLYNTFQKLQTFGYRLLLKLHPAHFRTVVPDTLRQLGIELCDNTNFVERLRPAVAAMVEPSTAAMIPALMGKPLLLIQYGKLAGQLYGPVLTTYPRAKFLKNLDDLPHLLEAEQGQLNQEAFQLWFDENAGPLPAEEMPMRVTQAVLRVIAEGSIT